MDEILNEDVGVAVDDRRHDSVVHLAKVLFITFGNKLLQNCQKVPLPPVSNG